VRRDAASYGCNACGAQYPIRYGIPDFRLKPDPYISIDAEVAKIEGFAVAGRSFRELVRAYYVLTPECPPELHSHYIAAMAAGINRGAGLLRRLRLSFPRLGTARLLDLGCGTAGMSIAGSRQYGEVIGVDVALRWLVMGQQRLREEGVNVSLVCANAESLPFHSGTFDAVVADAVVEHVNNPGAMRDETLRVINQTGAFLFTTNNRFSLLREPHLRLWGFGLVPRRWMEPLAWRIRKTPYKVRLLSRRALVRLFSGRADVLLPQYDEGELGPRNEGLRRAWTRLNQAGLFRVLIRNFAPQYFVMGSRRDTPRAVDGD